MMFGDTRVWVGIGLLFGALVVLTNGAGCGGNSNTTSSSGSGGGGNGGGGGASSSVVSSSGASSSGGGSGGGLQSTTIQEITNGTLGPGSMVTVTGVVVMSHKFLVSKSNSGSCLWGALISDPNVSTTAKNTGLMIISYGSPAMIPPGGNTALCPVLGGSVPVGDALPDDLTPGDVLDLSGETSAFAPSACMAGTAKQIQLRVDPGHAVRTGVGHALPAPYVMSSAEVAEYAGQVSVTPNFHRDWGGVFVRVQDETYVPPPDPFCQMFMEGNNLLVTAKLFYQGSVPNLMDMCLSCPVYSSPAVTFTRIDGFLLLDFCTWALAPTDRCQHFLPPSDDCPPGASCN